MSNFFPLGDRRFHFPFAIDLLHHRIDQIGIVLQIHFVPFLLLEHHRDLDNDFLLRRQCQFDIMFEPTDEKRLQQLGCFTQQFFILLHIPAIETGIEEFTVLEQHGEHKREQRP